MPPGGGDAGTKVGHRLQRPAPQLMNRPIPQGVGLFSMGDHPEARPDHSKRQALLPRALSGRAVQAHLNTPAWSG